MGGRSISQAPACFSFEIADFYLAVFMGVDMWTRLIKSIGGPSKAERSKGD